MFEKIGDTYKGFTVTRIRENRELHGRMVELVYEKTGTEICWLDNGELNKTFSIAFKTVPENSTGVFHILEHSVLCGSEKYPVKEPFVELIKSSLNTFINAITFPDKTMYPVCSRNDRDYLNLMGVYLDAVLAPRILTDPNIFYQEGRHIEQAEDGSLSYKGVVFNEMKGAMSSQDDVIEEGITSLLFPDTCYGFNSGGDPAVIPDLTYEQFVETYKRFYHPSNARVYLDGAVPVAEAFELIGDYLDRFERSTVLPEIALQIPKAAEATLDFAVDPDETLENKGFLCLGKIVGTWEDRTAISAMKVLNNAIAGSNESPMKRAILSAGLAEEAEFSISDYTAQPFFTITLKNVADGKEEEVKALIRATAEKMLAEGLDKEAIEASLNRYAYDCKDVPEPQGLERAIDMLNTWLHGGDPMTCLVWDERIAQLRTMLSGDGFENILKQLYLDDSALVTLKGRPSHTYAQELTDAEEKRLAETAAAWTEEDRAANALLNEKLLAWQQTPDSAEALATMPQLPLSEIGEDIDFTPTVESKIDGVTTLYHPVAANGIVHTNLYFDLGNWPLEKVTALDLMLSMFGSMETECHSARELEKLQKNVVGGFGMGLTAFPYKDHTDICRPALNVSCSFLRDKQGEAEKLIREIMLGTRFNADRVKEKLIQKLERRKASIPDSGQMYGRARVAAHYGALGAFNEMMIGYSAVRYLKQTAVGDFDRFFAGMEEMYDLLKKEVLVRSRLTVSVTSDEPADMKTLIGSLPEGEPATAAVSYRLDLPMREGFCTTGRAGYSVQAAQLQDFGIPYDGSMRVAMHAASYGYLWNTVRVQGGAYGTGISAGMNGMVTSYSFRDPTPARSLKMNGTISDYIRELTAGDEPLEKFIIATIGEMEPLDTPDRKGIKADGLWFSGRTKGELLEERKQVLATDREKLLGLCEMFDRFAAEGAVCVTGYEDQLKDCGELSRIEI